MITTSAAQFFAFFAKTKDGRAKDFSRKMACEKFAKKGTKLLQNCPKFALKSWPILHSSYLIMKCLKLINCLIIAFIKCNNYTPH